LLVVFFPLPLSVKAGFHPVAQCPFVLRKKGFPVTVQRRDGFLFAIAKLSVTPTLVDGVPRLFLFLLLLYHICISNFHLKNTVFTDKRYFLSAANEIGVALV
jgi:hypothetical protein